MNNQKYAQPQITSWKDNFDQRQQKAIKAALDISNKYSDAGIPGHSLFIIIAKQNEIIEHYERMITTLANPTYPLKLDVQNNYNEEIELAKKIHMQQKLDLQVINCQNS